MTQSPQQHCKVTHLTRQHHSPPGFPRIRLTTKYDKPLPYYQTDPTQPIDTIAYTPTREDTRAPSAEATNQQSHILEQTLQQHLAHKRKLQPETPPTKPPPRRGHPQFTVQMETGRLEGPRAHQTVYYHQPELTIQVYLRNAAGGEIVKVTLPHGTTVWVLLLQASRQLAHQGGSLTLIPPQGIHIHEANPDTPQWKTLDQLGITHQTTLRFWVRLPGGGGGKDYTLARK